MASLIKILIFILYLFNNILTRDELKGVYLINSIMNNNRLFGNIDNISFKPANISNEFNQYYFRIKQITINLFIIESITLNKQLISENNNHLKLIDNNIKSKNNNIYWNIIKINNEEYLIQNNRTKKYLENNNNSAQCSKDISFYLNNKSYKNISSNFKFQLIKLYEKTEINPENLKFIDKEPIDVVIKYIDLSDKKLNRQGIHQFSKDEDHEELRYCVRSIFENIPWFRKIFIVMPNENVRYFKPKDEIKERIIYIKDKDVIGFDTASNRAFLFRLWNMEKFNLSENIILMDDDYFIGKPLKKSDLFYYDEKQKKVLPNIVSDEFKELNKNIIYNQYNHYFLKKDKINPNNPEGSQFHKCAGLKLLLDNYPKPLIDAGYTHNAIPLNIHDVKEIYNFVNEKYNYAKEFLNAKERTVYDIQFHTLYNAYTLNVKKRKVHSIPRKFFDLNQLKKNTNLDVELFVINTSGENKYSRNDFENLKKILESKFNKSTPYEIVINKNIYENNMQIKNKSVNIKNIINNNISNTFKLDNNSKNILLNYEKEIEKYKKENNEMKQKIENLKKQINELTLEKDDSTRKNNNYLIIFIFPFIGIIIIIFLFILKYCNINYIKHSKYLSINDKEKEKSSESDEKYSLNNN